MFTLMYILNNINKFSLVFIKSFEGLGAAAVKNITGQELRLKLSHELKFYQFFQDAAAIMSKQSTPAAVMSSFGL